MKIHFIRHATIILYINDKRVLVDPLFSSKNTMSAVPDVPNKDDNPLTELPVTIDELAACDAVLVTHMHRDHFDSAASEAIPKSTAIFCQPEDMVKLKEFGFTEVTPVENACEWSGIKIIRTKGKHGHDDFALKMAPVSGFVITAPGEPVIYITGDTVWCSDTEKAIDMYNPEIIICNCGEARFSQGRAITMDAEDILSVCRKAPAAQVVAIHMEAWNHCRLSRKELRDFTADNGVSSQVLIPRDGEVLE